MYLREQAWRKKKEIRLKELKAIKQKREEDQLLEHQVNIQMMKNMMKSNINKIYNNGDAKKKIDLMENKNFL